jgi:hypothetical protein
MVAALLLYLGAGAHATGRRWDLKQTTDHLILHRRRTATLIYLLRVGNLALAGLGLSALLGEWLPLPLVTLAGTGWLL